MFCVQHAVEEKLQAKRLEKFGLRSDLLLQQATSRELIHLPSTIEERRFSLSSTNSADFKSVGSQSCESEDFVIHRRPSIKKNFKLDLGKLDDRNSASSFDNFKVSDSGIICGHFTNDAVQSIPISK